MIRLSNKTIQIVNKKLFLRERINRTPLCSNINQNLKQFYSTLNKSHQGSSIIKIKKKLSKQIDYGKCTTSTQFYKNFKRCFISPGASESGLDSENSSLFITENSDLPSLESINSKVISETENEEAKKYKLIMEIIKGLTIEFKLDFFHDVIDYINENGVTDVFLFRQFEIIFVSNLNLIDYTTKSVCVTMLGDFINKKKTAFNEDNWLKILRDFQLIFEDLKFADYYHYLTTFDRLFIWKRVQENNGKYNREFENYISQIKLQNFNSGKVAIQTVEDIFMLAKLTHSGVINITSIGGLIWSQINEVVARNSSELSIYELIVITTLFINFLEVNNMNSQYLLTQGIRRLNKEIHSLIINYDLCDGVEKANILESSDSIFYYFVLLKNFEKKMKFRIFNKKGFKEKEKENAMSDNENTEQDFKLPMGNDFLNKIIQIYTDKLLSKNHDFMLIKEIRILIFLAMEVEYTNEEFWSMTAEKTLEFINKDFTRIINEIFPKRIAKNSLSEEEKMRMLEKSDIKILNQVGCVIATFSYAGYTDFNFWELLLQKLEAFANLKSRSAQVMLFFISSWCKKLYQKEAFILVWDLLVDMMDPNIKGLFINREIVHLLLKIIDLEYEKHGSTLEIGILNKCISGLFTETQTNDLNQIKLFSQFFFIVENVVKNDEKLLRILANTLVDLAKLSSENKQSDFELKLFQTKLTTSLAQNFSCYIKERVFSLIQDCDLYEESDKKSFYYLVRKMENADLINRLDIVQIKMKIEKEAKFTQEREILFNRLLNE
jgi:hypothetical protein